MDVETLEKRHSDFFAPAFVVKVGGDDLVRDLFLTVSSVKVDLKEKAAGRFDLTVTNAFSWEHREFVAGADEERVDLLELFQFGPAGHQASLFDRKESAGRSSDGHRLEQGDVPPHLKKAVRELRLRLGHSPLYRVVEVDPWSRIPERRHALMRFDP